MTLEIRNPNPYQLECVKIVYEARKKSDNTFVAEGTMPQRVAVPALGATGPVVVPVTASYGGVLAAGASIAQRGKTDLLFSGEMSFEGAAGGRLTVVPYSLEGTILMENLDDES